MAWYFAGRPEAAESAVAELGAHCSLDVAVGVSYTNGNCRQLASRVEAFTLQGNVTPERIRPVADRRGFLKSIGTGSVAAMIAAAESTSTALQAQEQNVPNLGFRDEPRVLRASEADIGSLFPTMQQLADVGDYPYSYLSGRFRSLDEFKAAGREKVWDALGRRPLPTDAKPEVLDRQDLGEFVREKLLFWTTPDLRVPAYIHVPKRLQAPAPAIIDLHSHGGMFLFGKEKVIDFGRNHPVMTDYHVRNYDGRPTTTELVRRGYVVITIDAFMFGERRLMMDADLQYGWQRSSYSIEAAQHLNQVCRAKESTLVKSLAFAGYTWPGVVAWDDLRTVDYLLTRPEVDPRRIGCVGVSMGGHRALYLAALDERIAAACVVGFMSTVKPMLRSHIDTHSFVHFIPALHQWLDMPDVVSMMAPKPLMVQQCRQDGLFPAAGMEQSIEKLVAVYDKAGVSDRFAGRFYDGGHRFDVPMQEDAFRWLDQHLKR